MNQEDERRKLKAILEQERLENKKRKQELIDQMERQIRYGDQDPPWSPGEPPCQAPRLQEAPQWVEDLVKDPTKFEALIKNLVKQALQVVTGRLNDQEGKLDRHERQLSTMDGAVLAQGHRNDRHERELDAINRGLGVQANDLAKHDERLARLEAQAKRAATLEIKIAALEAENAALAARLKDLNQAGVQDIQQQLDDHLYFDHGVNNELDERYRDLATTVPGRTHRPASEA